MTLDTQAAAVSRSALWSARILSALVALFLLFDAVGHMAKPAPVVDAFARLGYPLSASLGIGIVERVGSPLFEAYIFPFLVGLLVWGGIWLRDARLRALFPLRVAG